MIAVNATLGTGLYWRGGQILELGGFLAVIISFLLLGILSWLVTQCITELLCIWPVPGAMSVFVREFVDFELGITVGVAYWLAMEIKFCRTRSLTYHRFTYSVSFAALIAYTAEEVHYWTSDVEDGIDAGVLYLLVPVILIVLNCFGIRVCTSTFIENIQQGKLSNKSLYTYLDIWMVRGCYRYHQVNLPSHYWHRNACIRYDTVESTR